MPPFERDVNTVFQDYALFPHMTVGDNVAYGLDGPEGAKRDERDAPGGRGAADGPPRGLRGAQARPAVRRPAPAGRPRARAREPAAGPAARRAARRARPEAPRGDADRAQGDPAGGRDHVHLRDPRPGGGAHDERPPRRVQRGPDRAGRHARRALRASGHPVRRRLRRHVEPAHGGGRHGRSSAGTARSPSGPRRSASCRPTRPPRATTIDRGRHDPRCRLPRPRHALHRDARCGRASSSSPSRTWRRPRPRRSPSRASPSG